MAQDINKTGISPIVFPLPSVFVRESKQVSDYKKIFNADKNAKEVTYQDIKFIEFWISPWHTATECITGEFQSVGIENKQLGFLSLHSVELF